MAEIQPYDGKKPSFFPLRTDYRPDRSLELNSEFNQSYRQANVRVKQELDRPNTKAKYTPEQTRANIQSTHDLSGIGSGLKFLQYKHKNAINLTGGRMNREQFDKDTYVSKEALNKMQAQSGERIAFYSQAALEEKRRRRAAESSLTAEELADIETVEGRENTYIHNANLFQRLDDRNIFKKGDKENYDTFNNNPLYNQLNQQFISALNSTSVIDNTLWDDVTMTMSRVTDANRAFNLENVNDQFIGNNVDKYNASLDYYDLLTSPELFENLTNKERFHIIMSAYADSQRFHMVYQEMYGMGRSTEHFRFDTDSHQQSENTQKIPTIADALAQEEIDQLADQSLKAAEKWWADIGSNVSNPHQLLAAGLVSELPETLSEIMNWGNLRDGQSISAAEQQSFADPRDLYVNGFFDHLNQEYLPEFKRGERIHKSEFQSDSQEESDLIWKALLSKGYVTQDGRIAIRFDLDKANLDIDFGFDDIKNRQIYTTLRNKKLGEFSMETQDITLIGGKERQNLRVYSDELGSYVDVPEMLKTIGDGDGWKGKVGEAKKAYDTLLKMVATMTGIEADGGSNGRVNVTPVPDSPGHVQMTIHNNASYSEWDPKAKRIQNAKGELVFEGAWKDVNNQPLTLTFESEADAQKYADKLMGVTQLLAPVLGMFAKEGLTVISNNAMSKDHTELLDPDHPDYRLSLSILDRYDSAMYKDAQNYILDNAGVRMSKDIMEKGMVNSFLRQSHENETEEYEEKLEEHEEKELQRIITEARDNAESRKRDKKAQKDALVAAQRLRAELRKAEQRRRKEQSQTAAPKAKKAKK